MLYALYYVHIAQYWLLIACAYGTIKCAYRTNLHNLGCAWVHNLGCAPPHKQHIDFIDIINLAYIYNLSGSLGLSHRQGVGACHGFAVPPTDIPGGERAAPPVLAFGSPDRPPLGTASPNASGIGSPSGLATGKAFLKKSFSFRRAAAKNSEEWRAIRLRIVRRYRNRPKGGMFATEYYTMACTVESDPCPARRRRGKRALLGVCAVPSLFAGVFRARKPRFWRFGVFGLPSDPIACATGQIWGLGGPFSGR